MILILGSTGYLGQAFAAELTRRGLPFEGVSRRALDYTRFGLLFQLVRDKKPELIINAAGYTGGGHPDAACDRDRAEAVRANTLLPLTIARVGYLTKTPWGHLSSGGIYSGAKVSHNGSATVVRALEGTDLQTLFHREPSRLHGFSESDTPNCTFRSGPCSFYSGTKALAEETLQSFKEGYVWRPAPVFDDSDHPRNLLIQLASQGRPAPGLGSIIHRQDLVNACLDLWQRRAPWGIYHLANPGAVLESEVRTLTANSGPHARTGGRQPDGVVNASLISSLLDTAKTTATGITLRPVQEALQATLRKQKPS